MCALYLLIFFNPLHYKKVFLVKKEEHFLAIWMCLGIHLNKLLPPGKGVMVASFLDGFRGIVNVVVQMPGASLSWVGW